MRFFNFMEDIQLLEGEKFIPLKNFERNYQISNFGRIYSNYNKELHKSIDEGDRYIITKDAKQKKLHIYDLYLDTFGEELFNWYKGTINKEKVKDLEGELWKPVVGWENSYEVSNLGRIKSLIRNTRTWKIRKETIMTPHISTYIQVKLSNESKSRMPLLHRLIAEAWIPNPNPEYFKVVDHIDFDKLNNKVENLRWVSQSMNIKHTYKAGRSKAVENGRSKSKINLEIAQEIRKFNSENTFLSQQQIGEKFGVSRSIVKDIIHNKSWVK